MRIFASAACAALVGSAALPALAQDAADPSALTCGDFASLSGDEQMSTLDALRDSFNPTAGDVAASGDVGIADAAAADAEGAATGSGMDQETLLGAVVAGCVSNAAMLVSEVVRTSLAGTVGQIADETPPEADDASGEGTSG